MNLIYFILCSYGLTQILVYSFIFKPVRPKHHFFHCPMCVGFWVGVFLLFISPYTELFKFEVSLINSLLLGFVSSGTSYVLSMLISDGGIQHEHRNRRSLDSEVETTPSSKVLQG